MTNFEAKKNIDSAYIFSDEVMDSVCGVNLQIKRSNLQKHTHRLISHEYSKLIWRIFI